MVNTGVPGKRPMLRRHDGWRHRSRSRTGDWSPWGGL